jgi:cellulose synthase/poly-beta-1,6-N-acetylglucosamine synthase-like glycosyltransferase
VLPEIAFWTASGTLVWVYAGYPVVAAVLARLRPVVLRPTMAAPTLTVAIAVHDEAAHIEARIADALAQIESGARIVELLVGSDGSTDATEEIVARLASRDPRIRLLALPRRGQTATQAVLFEAARGEAVVLTDAETRFAPGCLAAMDEALRDPRVGCVTGRLEWRDEAATATSAQEGIYWRYERRVRELESRAGLLTAVTGALLAVRASAYRAVPPTASMDHLLPLYVRAAGGLVIYVPDAVAMDRPISGLREQLHNRTRTATRGIRANLSMVVPLAPWRRPAPAIAIWSHKLLRWGTPWFMVIAAGSGLVLGLSGSPAYLAAPAGLVALGVIAAIAHVLISNGRRPPRIVAFARSFAVVNLAFATGWLNVVRGRGIEVWHRAEFRVEG